ncbi:MAG: hypothetical protein V4449_02585 [Patescibacteria group bacterium]
MNKEKANQPWGENLLLHYTLHHRNETRSELKKNYPEFYSALWEAGLVGYIPKTGKSSGWLETPLAHYDEQYRHLSSAQLLRQHPTLYNAIRAVNGLMHVAKSRRKKS